MINLSNMGTPQNSFAALAIVDALVQRLINKGVLTEDESRAMFGEVADMLRKMPVANAQAAGAAITKAKLGE